MASLPSGTITFLFTDIEGSTRLWDTNGPAMQGAVARHDALLRQAIEGAGGYVFKTIGDAFCAAFATAPDAVAAALAAQAALCSERWPTPGSFRVRMALHTGLAELRQSDYFGATLNRVARLLAGGHGGQTLLSEATYDLCRDHLPPNVTIKSLGAHALRDLARREGVFQLCHPDLPCSFPPLKTMLRPADVDIPSIAVLPFANLSHERENEYFADGLAEELLNVLSKVRGLRVASRTSAFFFKGKDADLATIAQKLNVLTVLEGSVRKAGNRVRITAQLIEVATDSHIWSETYDRELTDIFAVQDDISRHVLVELRRALLGDRLRGDVDAEARTEVAAASRGRADNFGAYLLVLEARAAIERNTRVDNERAIGLIRQALELEPDYALAWVGLASAYAQTASSAWVPFADGYARAREAALHALQLAPDIAEGHQAFANVLLAHDFAWRRAASEIQRAMELAPGTVQSLRGAAQLAAIEGRIEDTVAYAREIVTLDPMSLAAHRYLAWNCIEANRLDEAEAAIRAARELGPTAGHVSAALGCLRLRQGRFEEALAAFHAEPLPIYRGRGIAAAQHAMGHRAESDAALEELVKLRAETGPFQIAEVYAYRLQADEAFEWLDHALKRRDPGIAYVKATFFLTQIQNDPRWHQLLASMNLDGEEPALRR